MMWPGVCRSEGCCSDCVPVFLFIEDTSNVLCFGVVQCEAVYFFV